MDGNMMEGGGGQYVGPQSPVDLKPETSNLLTGFNNFKQQLYF